MLEVTNLTKHFGSFCALKDMTMIGEPVVFKSSLKDEDREILARLADEIAASIGN